jgi:hypothetical protein
MLEEAGNPTLLKGEAAIYSSEKRTNKDYDQPRDDHHGNLVDRDNTIMDDVILLTSTEEILMIRLTPTRSDPLKIIKSSNQTKGAI